MEITLLLAAVAALSSTASSLECNVSSLVNDNGGSDVDKTYFSGAHNGSCFIFVLKRETAKNARKYCRDIGGHLTNIDKSIQGFLKNFILSTNSNYSGFRDDFWIGLFWSAALDLYYWDNGADFDFDNMDRDGIGSCVILTKSIFEWNNIRCHNKKRFICKIEPRTRAVDTRTINDTVCADYCKAAVENYYTRNHGLTSTARIITTDPGLNISDRTTDNGSQKNVGGDGRTDGFVNGTQVSGEESVVIYGLAAILLCVIFGLSVLANAVMVFVICHYCRKDNNKGDATPGHIPLVDIMSADSSGAFLQSANNHGTEGDESVYLDPTEGTYESAKDGDTRGQTNNSEPGSSSVPVTYSDVDVATKNPTAKGPKSDGVGADAPNTKTEYTLLNSIGGKPKNPSPALVPKFGDVYGLDSASAPLPKASETQTSSQTQDVYGLDSAGEPPSPSAWPEGAIYSNQPEQHASSNSGPEEAFTYESYT